MVKDCHQTHVRHALRRNLKDTLHFLLFFIPIPAILSKEELNVHHHVKQIPLWLPTMSNYWKEISRVYLRKISKLESDSKKNFAAHGQ